MMGYLKADLWRISRRIPRIIAIIIFNIIFAVSIIKGSQGDSWNSVFFMDKMLSGFTFIMIGCEILEFISVFSDDFKAKTMQVAIGAGTKRRHVILTKWADCVILLAGDLLFACIVGLLTGMITGVHVNGEQITDLMITFMGNLLQSGGYYSLIMILVFYMQSVMIPLLVYLFLIIGLLNSLINGLFYIDAIQKLHLERFTLTNASQSFVSRLIVGSVDFRSLIIVLVYIAIGYVCSILLFKNKELEF